ncbi:serine hydrolase domain-containing protein [Qipengyuania marisflavi]|uniref:Serine hydrolase n=1 Tax=Qipengyuania marisflavi TaxID=2486356 RepID=A0A5S3P9U5_9SPHN|nr:serine hydrolase [Qipengyuania marisflavi]TMM50218.1 serine hydrolase [Qipengyuania marisflavi]
MIRYTLAVFTLLTAVPLFAQSQQEALDTRHDRALAAGYKALMVCGAVKNAEALRSERNLQSVEKNELVGTYSAFDPIIPTLETKIEHGRVSVAFADDMPPRIAVSGLEGGCSLLPIGANTGSPPNLVLTTYENRPPETMPWPEGNAVVPIGGSAGLRALISRAFDKHFGDDTNTTAVVILRDGKLLVERYKPGFGPLVPQRTWSVAKSIAATLVGASAQRGEVQVDSSAGLGLAENDARRAITLDHLLRMASGRYSDTPGNRTDPLYIGGATVEESAANWPLIYQPGSVFRYANNDTLMAVAAIKDSFDEHSPRRLFHTLGMHSTIAETDWQGDYILSSQVWSTARDLAKLGQLYLQDGVWDGQRILPEGWTEYVSSPSGPQPDGPFGYGAGFWLFNKSDGIPKDTIAAMGNRGQFIIIAPSLNAVIVRRGEDPAGSRFDIARFTRDVLESLTK